MSSVFNHRPRTGITLFEVIIVIGLLATSAATMLVMFDKNWTNRRLVMSVTNDLANSLQTARNTAISNRASVTVQRNQTGGAEKLLITEDAGPFRDSKNWTIEISDTVDLRGNPTEIEFSSTGRASRKVKWRVKYGGLTGIVTVTPLRGEVTRKLP